MGITLIFMMALAAVAAALITLVRFFGLRRVLRNAKLVDIIFTLLSCFALAGTLTGLLIGIVAGLVMTGTLTVLNALMGRVDAVKAAQAKPVNEAEDWCPGGTPSSL